MKAFEALQAPGGLVLLALILALVALAAVVLVWVRQQSLLRRYGKLIEGTSGGSLESVLNDHVARVQGTVASVASLTERLGSLEKANYANLQHLAIFRFNPFHDTGGDQSFAIALADDRGDGLVLSSLHARDATRVYAKPLRGWVSTYSLTEEEKQAIHLAHEQRA